MEGSLVGTSENQASPDAISKRAATGRSDTKTAQHVDGSSADARQAAGFQRNTIEQESQAALDRFKDARPAALDRQFEAAMKSQTPDAAPKKNNRKQPKP